MGRLCWGRVALTALTIIGVLALVPAAWAGSWQAVVSDASGGSSDAAQIDLGTGTAAAFATDGPAGLGVAFAPDANTGLIVDAAATGATGQVTPVDLSTGSAFARASIDIPSSPGNFVAVSPDGRLAYVTDPQDGKVFPVDLATSPATVGTPLSVGGNPEGVAFAPNGLTAYVAENANTAGTAELIPITVATGTLGSPITGVGPHPFSIAMAPNGTLALVGDSSNGDVYPVSLPSGNVGTPIPVGGTVHGIAVLPNGSAAYAANGSSVTPIALPGLTAGSPIPMTGGAFAVAATPNSQTIYVTNDTAATVTPVDVATATAGTPITGVGSAPRGIAITPDQAPVAAFTVGQALPGAATTFDASSSTVRYGTIASYKWNFGDGQTVTTSSPTTAHTYEAAGSYQVTVTETDSDGTSVSGEVYTGQSAASVGSPTAETSRTVVVTNAPAPAVNLSSSSLNFGSLGVGSPSSPLSVTISNTGFAALHPTHAAVNGPAAADFAISHDSCSGQSVASGATCVLTVVFTPTTAGARSAQLTLSDDASGSPQTIELTGVGVSTGAITGTVEDGSRSGDPPLARASVQICDLPAARTCAGLFTDASGHYRLDGLKPGRYEVTIDPPSGSTLSEGSRVADVVAGQTTDAVTVLGHNTPLPTSVGITSELGSTQGGDPTIFWNAPFQINLPAIRPLPAHGTPNSSVASLIVVELTTAGTDQVVLGSTLTYIQTYDNAGNASDAAVLDSALPGLVPGGFDFTIGSLAAPLDQPVLTSGTSISAATQVSATSTGLNELAHGAMTLEIIGLRASATTRSTPSQRARPVVGRAADACSDDEDALDLALARFADAEQEYYEAGRAYDRTLPNFSSSLYQVYREAGEEWTAAWRALLAAERNVRNACPPQPPAPPAPPCDVFLAESTGCTNTGDLYTDPSGLVTTTRGVPIEGAKVVLKRSTTAAGPFRPVPNHSVYMSPANRRNPDHTDIDGHFGWDVFPGYYRVSATRHGCIGSASTRSRRVPPPVSNLHLELRCPNLRRTPTTVKIASELARGPDTDINVRTHTRHGHPSGLIELTVNGKTVAQAFLNPRAGDATLIAPAHLRPHAHITVLYTGNAQFAPSSARRTH